MRQKIKLKKSLTNFLSDFRLCKLNDKFELELEEKKIKIQ